LKTNIPIYRAKKIDSNEYVEGYYSPRFFTCMGGKICHTINTKDGNQYKIDQSTLAIHFPDMLDSDNKKIFASLGEDGKGGDTLESDSIYGKKSVSILTSSGFSISNYDNGDYYTPDYFVWDEFKVVGIQE